MSMFPVKQAKSTATNDSVRARTRRERQSDILDAGIAVIAQKGYHDTRIADIAERAGVAYGLVYHYFGSKENILTAIFENLWQRFEVRIQRIAAQQVSCVEKLSEISDYMIDTLLARPDIIHLLVYEIVRARNIEKLPDMEIVRRIIALIEDILNEAIEGGELSDDADPRLLALTFFGSVEMVLTSLITGTYRNKRRMTSAEAKDLKRKMRSFVRGGSFGRAPSQDRGIT